MNLHLRNSKPSDIPFLREMLYEAVFWRPGADKPPVEEGLAYPGINKSLADLGERDGDTAVVALVNSFPAGAAWYRFWTADDFIRGYIEEITPVLVVAVHSNYRRQGIGRKMIDWLIDHASKQSIQKIKLSFSSKSLWQDGNKRHSISVLS